MQIFSTPELLRSYISDQRHRGKTIGLVPTMGALHRGHLELIRKSMEANDITVCSIYINPVQFNNRQDLLNYPRDLDLDMELLKNLGCQVVFCPADEIMYPGDPVVSLNFGKLEEVMEGAHRPGHFNGVALVVSKFFHMAQPHKAYFGEKDWQQLVIIKQMVKDLNFPVEVVGMPIIREGDGLAMSSRNQRLTSQQRSLAPELYRTLKVVKDALERQTPIDEARRSGIEYLLRFPSIRLQYLEVVRSNDLEIPRGDLSSESLSICIAAFLGEIRLIDNVQVFNRQIG